MAVCHTFAVILMMMMKMLWVESGCRTMVQSAERQKFRQTIYTKPWHTVGHFLYHIMYYCGTIYHIYLSPGCTVVVWYTKERRYSAKICQALFYSHYIRGLNDCLPKLLSLLGSTLLWSCEDLRSVGTPPCCIMSAAYMPMYIRSCDSSVKSVERQCHIHKKKLAI